VVGADSERAREIMLELYGPFVRTGHPIITMDVRSAELTKYAANAMLATKISFMNEIARICDRVGANVEKVRLGIGSDTRIGPQFLFPGIGYGGSCFPKDVKAIIKTAQEYDYDFRILQAVEEVNAGQKRLMVDMVKDHFGDDLGGKTFALWGLSFKPRTDDMREAPSLEVIKGLSEAGARFKVYDPEAMEECERKIGDAVEYASDNYAALEGADALIIATEWSDFREPDFDRMKSLLKEAVIFDGRNIYKAEKVRGLGFSYRSIGRP
jgi:UDPglucose 6-dehydrogenase